MACVETGRVRASAEVRHHPQPIEVRAETAVYIFPPSLMAFHFRRVEEELRFLSDTTDGDSASKRTLARRSFFRRKKHQRSSSRDSKDLSSFSSTQLSWFSDSGIVGEDGTLASYQRVERLNCKFLPIRPRSSTKTELPIHFNRPTRRCMPASFDLGAVG